MGLADAIVDARFNPRPREGTTSDLLMRSNRVSIHAPAKGATAPSSAKKQTPSLWFQSTPRERDDWNPQAMIPTLWFQSTPREGGDLLDGHLPQL